MERKDRVGGLTDDVCVELGITQKEMVALRGAMKVILGIRHANSWEDLEHERGIAEEIDTDTLKEMNGIIEDPIGTHEQPAETIR
jgi:hypothetical protein